MSFETNIGHPIEDAKFMGLVKKLMYKMTIRNNLELTEYIEMVMVYNTIEANKLFSKNQRFKEYAKLFQSQYLSEIISKLDARLTKGMAWYSQKHNLYIGGQPHQNSQFRLNQSLLEATSTPAQ